MKFVRLTLYSIAAGNMEVQDKMKRKYYIWKHFTTQFELSL